MQSRYSKPTTYRDCQGLCYSEADQDCIVTIAYCLSQPAYSPFRQSNLKMGTPPTLFLDTGFLHLSFRILSLLQAVTSGDEKAVSAMLADGADVNATNDGGQTPLILAIISGQDHLLRPLLDAGADPLLKDKTGLNAVDWAERKGRAEFAQLLTKKQSEESPFRALAEKRIDTEPKSKPPPEDLPPLSSDEKSRRWLAGLKQRLEEKASREPVQPERVPNQTEPTRSQIPPSAVSDPVRPQSVPEIKINPQPSSVEPAKVNKPSRPVPSKTAKKTSKPLSSRKRCPECNAIYDSELLAYCAHHIVPLVDADEPLPYVPPPNRSGPVLWVLVLITLSAAVFTGVFVTSLLIKQNDVATPSDPAQPVFSTRKGVPVVGRELAGKAVALPWAEVPSKGGEQAASVIVRVKIDKDGRVYSALSTSNDRMLRDAAIEAAMGSMFSTQKLGGRKAEGTITYTFNP
jgi:Ankyrin repeats (3 copies)